MEVVGVERLGVTTRHKIGGLSLECGTPVFHPHGSMTLLSPSQGRGSQSTPLAVICQTPVDWRASSSPSQVWSPLQSWCALLTLHQASQHLLLWWVFLLVVVTGLPLGHLQTIVVGSQISDTLMIQPWCHYETVLLSYVESDVQNHQNKSHWIYSEQGEQCLFLAGQTYVYEWRPGF